MWTLRADGVLFIGAPRDSFEDFGKRALTEEKLAAEYAAVVRAGFESLRVKK